jgi:hypothetical protein
MEQLLSIQNQIVGIDDRNNWNELQSNLCGVVIVRRLDHFFLFILTYDLTESYSVSFASLAKAFNRLLIAS